MAVHCGFPTHSVLPMCSAPSNSSHQPASPDPKAHCLPPTLRRRAPERSRHLSPASPPSLLLSAAVIHSTDGAETLSPADVLSHSAHPSPVVMPPEANPLVFPTATDPAVPPRDWNSLFLQLPQGSSLTQVLWGQTILLSHKLDSLSHHPLQSKSCEMPSVHAES